MEPLTRYYIFALQTTPDAFAATHTGIFLLKHPSPGNKADASRAADEPSTKIFSTAEAESLQRKPASDNEWLVAPVRRRPDSTSPPGVITVGRTRTCDLVLDSSSVSKVHAHFLVREGKPMELADQYSGNATYLNGRPLAPNRGLPVRSGDKVRFGMLTCELLDGAAFHAFLRARERSEPE